MKSDIRIIDRRCFLNRAAMQMAAATVLYVPSVIGEQSQQTPRQTEGPFYPNKMPPDTDNDLLIINDKTSLADGTITHLTGRVVNLNGEPVRNAVVEIWQCDNNGRYLHTGDQNPAAMDISFQGFGRFLTGLTGEYYFRTIKPVPYPGRTPHIHFIVRHDDKRMLTTQLYIKGFPQNARDGIYRTLQAPELASADFVPLKGSTRSELTAYFQIVLGETPEDPRMDRLQDMDRPGRRG
jgi:protocatechuate 3,4-dioxygenase beta subunit